MRTARSWVLGLLLLVPAAACSSGFAETFRTTGNVRIGTNSDMNVVVVADTSVTDGLVDRIFGFHPAKAPREPFSYDIDDVSIEFTGKRLVVEKRHGTPTFYVEMSTASTTDDPPPGWVNQDTVVLRWSNGQQLYHGWGIEGQGQIPLRSYDINKVQF